MDDGEARSRELDKENANLICRHERAESELEKLLGEFERDVEASMDQTELEDVLRLLRGRMEEQRRDCSSHAQTSSEKHPSSTYFHLLLHHLHDYDRPRILIIRPHNLATTSGCRQARISNPDPRVRLAQLLTAVGNLTCTR